MKASQIVTDLQRGKEQGKEFIKWWRKENDFTDYELLDNFINTAASKHEIDSYQLLDNDEMWDILKRWKPTGLRRSKSTKSDNIEWQRKNENGEKQTYVCPYNSHNIMSIFDAETRNNTVG
ncbi:hypothetical protein [Malonomonas rubra]|uniref:hypothetical protein n=1 Tax=Malonomonas rubra TaxID=57040 RepID=UPI0026ECEA0E|nr:hypothetical protein [Malonomonas rubra]